MPDLTGTYLNVILSIWLSLQNESFFGPTVRYLCIMFQSPKMLYIDSLYISPTFKKKTPVPNNCKNPFN